MGSATRRTDRGQSMTIRPRPGHDVPETDLETDQTTARSMLIDGGSAVLRGHYLEPTRPR
jgi:hypothetical protein